MKSEKAHSCLENHMWKECHVGATQVFSWKPGDPIPAEMEERLQSLELHWLKFIKKKMGIIEAFIHVLHETRTFAHTVSVIGFSHISSGDSIVTRRREPRKLVVPFH